MATTLARLLSVALIALGLLASAARAEAADGSSPETALPLRAEQAGSIPGGPGGHFAYFRFAYPGGWPVHLELRPNTENKLVLKYVGYKVYGPEPNREYVDGRLDQDEVWQGGRDLVSDDQGVYYVQVYNYNPNPGTVLNFTLLAGDLPPQPEEGQSAPGPVPGSAGHVAIPIRAPGGEAARDEGTEIGTLAAEAGGTFRYYQFHQPRDTSVTINLQVSPNSAGVLGRAGFKVYGPERGKEYLQSEADTGRTPNQRGSLWVTQDGIYIVQVHNYNADVPIEYRLWLSR
jgi:hypothetical protein